MWAQQSEKQAITQSDENNQQELLMSRKKNKTQLKMHQAIYCLITYKLIKIIM